jgi:rod shape-determining protein MreB
MYPEGILRIVVASPSDVQVERDVLPLVEDELNDGIAAERGVRVIVSRWETDAYPGFHAEGPQGLIDPILNIEDCDVLIGVFWKRFGTPTKGAKSGTEYEIWRAYESWKKTGRPHIMVYFNQKPYLPKSKEETEQWGDVLEFQKNFPGEGLWWPYEGENQFERLVRNHLTKFIRNNINKFPTLDKEKDIEDTEAQHLSQSLSETVKQPSQHLDREQNTSNSKSNSQISLRKGRKGFLESLRDFLSDSMAIDVGSYSTIIAVSGRGIVIDEPSALALTKYSGEVIAIGKEALEMEGREARDMALAWPIINGAIANYEFSQRMLDYFVRKARSGFSQFARRAVMSLISDATQVEQRALLTVAELSHIGRVYLVEEGLAAAIGAGVSVEDKKASAVVDVGGGTTNIAVIARGTTIKSKAERVGSIDIDDAISDRLQRHHGLIISASTAETLKIELGSAIEPDNPSRSLTVKGRDVQTGVPRAIEVTSEEICIAAEGVLKRITRGIRNALSELQPKVAADIYDRGLILTGGGALLDGMAEFVQRETRLQTRMPDEPRYAIVRGLSQLYDEPLLLRRVALNEQPYPLDEADKAFE